METAEFKELLNRYREGRATTEEVAWLESWYMDLGKADKVVMDEAELNEARELIWKQFAAAHQIGPVKRRLWPRIAVAAAAVAAITLGTWIYMNEVASSRKAPRNDEVVMNDIAPGKNGATITLANGKVIQLSDAKSGVVIGDGRIAYSSLRGGTHETSSGQAKQSPLHDEVASIPRNNVMQLTASTAKGQTYQFTLPDGTKVWLNADSKISFPSQFSGKERKILLSGEAYFEVSKLTRKPTKPIDKGTLPREKNGMERVPFMVETDQQIVEVLGTHFNVNSYADEGNTKTTLLEGSVRVLYPAKGPAVPSFYRDDIVLKPNQQSILTGSGRIAVANVDVSEALDWKNGEFKFKEETVESIMRKVARWYDVDVIYEKDAPRDIKLGGIVSRSRNVSAVLKMMELTNRVKFKIEGRKIVVQAYGK